MELSSNKKNKEKNESILDFKQHSVNLYNQKEKLKKNRMTEEIRELTVIQIFSSLFYILLFTVADIIIQYKNNIGKNNLLIDDYLFFFDIVIIIISTKYCKRLIYFHGFCVVENIVNDIIFFVSYIRKYKTSKHVFNFFISYCVIKFIFSSYCLRLCISFAENIPFSTLD